MTKRRGSSWWPPEATVVLLTGACAALAAIAKELAVSVLAKLKGETSEPTPPESKKQSDTDDTDE